jgi:hypothetical protein
MPPSELDRLILSFGSRFCSVVWFVSALPTVTCSAWQPLVAVLLLASPL